jgi:hypothetical protein
MASLVRSILLCLLFLVVYSASFGQFTPSDLPGLEMWVRADSAVTINAEGFVTQWNDLSGQNHHCTTPVAASRTTRVANAIGNSPAIRFDGVDDYFQFPEVTNARTVFWVVRENEGIDPSNPRRGLLGHSSGIFWLRGADRRMWDAQASPFVLNGTSRINFNNVNGLTTALPNDYSVISLTTTGNVPATHLTMYFGVTVRNWSGDFVELIIYNQVLSTDEVMQVENYLADRYSPLLPELTVVDASHQFCDTTVCAPAGFESYLWDNGSTDPCRVFSSSGTYNLQTTDRFGRVKSSVYSVQFPEQPNLHTLSACSPESVSYESPLPPNAFTFNWSNGSQSSLFETQESGEYSVTVTDAFGCAVTDTFSAFIDPFAFAELVPDTAFLCSGSELTAALSSNEEYIFSWNTSTDSIYTATVSEIVSLYVQNQNGCLALDTTYIEVQGDAPQLTIQTSGLCNNEPFIFTAVELNGAMLSSIEWQIDGTVQGNEASIQTVLTPGAHHVRLFATNEQDCSAVIEQEINVREAPLISYATQGICLGDTIAFSAVSNQEINNTEWIISNQIYSTEQVELVFPSIDPISVQLTVFSLTGCSSTFIGTVFLEPIPEGTVNTSGLCLGELTELVFEPTNNGSGSITQYHWQFGDNTGSLVASPSHYYAQVGVYEGLLSVTASNGCSANIPFQHEHSAQPMIDFPLTNACLDQPFTLSGQSLNSDDLIANWEWTINQSELLEGQTVTTLFTSLGLVPVQLQATTVQGCSTSLTQAIAVWPVPNALFTVQPDVFSTDLTQVFTNLSEGQNLFSEWSFGDGTTSTETQPNHTFAADTAYTVSLSVVNAYGCSDQFSQSITPQLPRLDIELLSLMVSSTDTGEELTIRCANAGNITIPSALFRWQGGGEIVLSENYNSALAPGEIIDFTFASQWEAGSFTFDYLCVQAEAEGLPLADSKPENNIQCNTMGNSGFRLFPPFPNPGDKHMFVRLSNTRESNINLRIVDGQGRLLQDLVDTKVPPGFHQYLLDISTLSNGAYTLIMLTENTKQSVGFIKKAE